MSENKCITLKLPKCKTSVILLSLQVDEKDDTLLNIEYDCKSTDVDVNDVENELKEIIIEALERSVEIEKEKKEIDDI